MVCIFCVKESSDGIILFGDSDEAKTARNIIVKYFWFDINEINSITNYSCPECWLKVEAFHEFYRLTELIHKRRPYDINDGIHIETDFITIDSHIPDYKCVYASALPILEQPADDLYNKSAETELQNSVDDAVVPIPEKSDVSKPQNNVSTRPRGRQSLKAKPPIAEHSKPKEEVNKKKKKWQKITRTVNKIVCYMCNKQLMSFHTLRRHFQVHDPIDRRVPECKLCKAKFSCANSLKTHACKLRERYKEKSKTLTTCPVCEKSLTQGSLWLHIQTMHKKKQQKESSHMCDVCGKQFKDMSELRKHAVIHLDKKLTEVQCDICDKWIKNRYVLRAHRLMHDRSPKQCPHCDKIKYTARALTAHIALAHSPPKHKCTICEKSFTRPKSLREHVATHTGIPLYDCMYCTRKFKSIANKYKHLREWHSEQWDLDRAKN